MRKYVLIIALILGVFCCKANADKFSSLNPKKSAASVLVAAYNAPSWIKLVADYQCTGSYDDIVVQKAIDTMAANGGGEVVLSIGGFTPYNPLKPRSNVWVHGMAESIYNSVNNCPDLYFDVNNQSGTIITAPGLIVFKTDPCVSVFGFELTNVSFHDCNGIADFGTDQILGGGYCQFRDLIYTNDTTYASNLGSYDNIGVRLTNYQHCWLERIETRGIDRIALIRNIITADPCAPNPNSCQPGIATLIDCFGNPYSGRARDGCIKVECNNVIIGWNIYLGAALGQVNIIRPQINNGGSTGPPNVAAQICFYGHRNKLYTATSTTALTVGDIATQASSGATATVLASDTAHLLLEWASGVVSATFTYGWTDQHSHTFTPTATIPTSDSWVWANVGGCGSFDSVGEGGYYGHWLHGCQDMQVRLLSNGATSTNAAIRCEYVTSAILYGCDPGISSLSIDTSYTHQYIQAYGNFSNANTVNPGDAGPAGYYTDVANGGLQFSAGNGSSLTWVDSTGLLVPINASVGRMSVDRTSSITAWPSYGEVTYVDATGGAVTITVPYQYVGQVCTIKKIDSSSNAVTVDAGSGNTIDGSRTYTLSSQYNSVTVQHYSGSYSGSAIWYIINKM
jgi:hypothetical protein